MLITPIFNINNGLRNFSYLLSCRKTNKAIIIDPLDAIQCLQIANKLKVNICYIINTHEHWDHTQGNDLIKKHTSAKILSHKDNSLIFSCNGFLEHEEEIKLGEEIRLRCLYTPGHTLAHICLLGKIDNKHVIFTGDTLFNIGIGNCYSGSVRKMYETISNIFYALPEDTAIYPGHDYWENNIEFALSLDKNNKELINLLKKIKLLSVNERLFSTIELEKRFNPFFRLDYFADKFKIKNDSFAVFHKIRELRNNW